MFVVLYENQIIGKSMSIAWQHNVYGMIILPEIEF